MYPLHLALALLLLLGLSPTLAHSEEPKDFNAYPPNVTAYLQRINTLGQQAFAFREDYPGGFDGWRSDARAELGRLIGLDKIAEQAAGHRVQVTFGDEEDLGFCTRQFCAIETEPSVSIPFYLLKPKDKEEGPFPLAVLPHGHSTTGHHVTAGVYADDAARERALAEDRDTALQAVKRGYIAIAPATRGLAVDGVPDLYGRHGKRECRSHVMHCLLAGRTAIGERVWDMQRIMDWAAALPEVDGSRILVMGNSGGGMVTLYTAACDPRVTCAVSSCSYITTTSPAGYIYHCDCNMVPGLLAFADLPDVAGLIAPRAYLAVNGKEDTLHSPSDVERAATRTRIIYEAAGAPEQFGQRWGDAGHRFYADLMWPFIDAAMERAEPMVTVKREVYVEHTKKGASRWVNVRYTGAGLEREETHTFMAKSDTPEEPKRRWSKDNGRTWSEFETLPDVVSHEHGARIYWGPGPMLYDAEHGVTVSIWLRQTKTDLYHNHSYSRISRDGGRTWSEPKQLRYEDGAFLDPANPLDPAYLKKNQSYFGNNIIRHSNSTLIHAGATVNVPYENKTGKSYDSRKPADSKNIGSVCFIGTWNGETKDYDWAGGTPVWVPLEVSARGLMEPDVVELKDGRVLVVWRGSDTPVTEGRKWFSLSEDGGMTLTQPAEWRYDDGTRFYSPSSIHRFFRHSVTGTLYWIGNACTTPPRGNSPRYPLIIAEVDESKAALKRDTVTTIDGLRPGDSAKLQLSNFCLLEDRESHALEVYLTRLGENPEDFWGADAYRYTLTFR